MRKTKIICTLGPATDSEEVLRGLIDNGMNIARLNFSHGSQKEHLVRLNMLRKMLNSNDTPVGMLMDTRGPEIRLKTFKNGEAFLECGELFTLTSNDVEGTDKICSVNYKNLPQDVVEGTIILLSDGLIELVVEQVDKDNIICRVLNSGKISDRKGVNVPGIKLSMPYISQKDRDDIIFAIDNGFDFIAASFVCTAQNVLEVKSILEEKKCNHIKIIAKIENSEGINNIDEIIKVSDGIMVARGDMGVEVNYAEIPIIQKKIICLCYNMGKPAITATQMLESMTENPRPTRAEITDVANAIYDGTSAIMLSGETAAGKHPVEAVKTMAEIALHTELDINYNKRLQQREVDRHLGVADAISHAACSTAMDINAQAIITVTRSGETARLLSKYRPSQPIIACVSEEFIARQLALSWGIIPIIMPLVSTTDDLIETSVSTTKKAGLVADGDMVVITAGIPVGIFGTTNMIKAQLVGNALISGVGIGNTTVRGNICICQSDDEIINKLKEGDVLIAPTTTNRVLDQMRFASAIITEEPGLNSHAAIVGLTLNKPVIVGANGATKLLKDGMLVSIDPEHGIVCAIPK